MFFPRDKYRFGYTLDHIPPGYKNISAYQEGLSGVEMDSQALPLTLLSEHF